MQKNPNENQIKESPFWNLLAGAEEVQIREVTAPNENGKEEVTTSIQNVLEEFDSDREPTRHRAFVIRVKTPKPAGHPPCPPPEPSDLRPKVATDEIRTPDRQSLVANAAILIENEGDQSRR